MTQAPSFKKTIEEMLRVNHAGECGALHIYEGQRMVFQNLPHKKEILHEIATMEAQEIHHKKTFDAWLTHYHIRPTMLAPLWRLGGVALGVATALVSEKAAFACTAAVETVIEKHYAQQIRQLEKVRKSQKAEASTRAKTNSQKEKTRPKNQKKEPPRYDLPEFLEILKQFRAEEMEHEDLAKAHGGKDTLAIKATKAAIEALCRGAIILSRPL